MTQLIDAGAVTFTAAMQLYLIWTVFSYCYYLSVEGHAKLSDLAWDWRRFRVHLPGFQIGLPDLDKLNFHIAGLGLANCGPECFSSVFGSCFGYYDGMGNLMYGDVGG